MYRHPPRLGTLIQVFAFSPCLRRGILPDCVRFCSSVLGFVKNEEDGGERNGLSSVGFTAAESES